MKLFPYVLLAVLCLVGFGTAQTSSSEFEFGKPSDLKGLTKVYVQTMGDLKENERIVTRINKAKVPNLENVEDIEDAEIVLVFGGSTFHSVVGVSSNTYGNSTNSSVASANLLQGEGKVFVAGRDNDKPKLIMRVQNEQEDKAEKRPVTKFVEEFIKVYKKINGLN